MFPIGIYIRVNKIMENQIWAILSTIGCLAGRLVVKAGVLLTITIVRRNKTIVVQKSLK